MSESKTVSWTPTGEKSVTCASFAPKLPPQSVVSTIVIAMMSPAVPANVKRSASPAWVIEPDSKSPREISSASGLVGCMHSNPRL